MNQANTQNNVFDTVPYLLQHISSVLDKQFAAELEESVGITLSQLRVINALQQQPRAQQSSIAEFLGQSESAVSRQVALLEEDGYIIRKKNPNDGRQRLLVLCPAATRVAAAATRVRQSCYQRVLQAALGPQSVRRLQNELNLLHDSLCSSSAYGCDQHTE